MANKQTLPQMNPVQGGFINTQGAPQIPAIRYQSPLRDIAVVTEQAADFTKSYQDLRFNEYQAKYDNMAMQMYHEMNDATDPCQLQEIKNKYDEAYKQPLDNTIWAKSYNQSRYKQDWTNRMNTNYEKVYLQKMHEFTGIQTEKTLNEMSAAAALTGDPVTAGSYFDAGINLIGNEKHLTATEKNNLQMNYAKSFIGKLYTQDPNFALSFVNMGEKGLAKYGIDVNEVRNKANAYNKAREREAKEERNAAVEFNSKLETAQAESIIARIRKNEISETDGLAAAGQLSDKVYNKVYDKFKTKEEKRDITALIAQIRDASDKEAEVKKIYSEHLDLNKTERADIKDYAKIFTNKENISDDDIVYMNDLENGRTMATNSELEKRFSGETLEKALKARDAGDKVIAEKLKSDEQEKNDTGKEESAKNLLALEEQLLNEDDPLTFYNNNKNLLNTEDAGKFFTKASQQWETQRKADTEADSKKNEEEFKKLHNAEYTNILADIRDNPSKYTDDVFESYARKGFEISEIEKMLTAKDNAMKAKVEDHNSFVRFKAAVELAKGNAVDPNSYADNLINVDRQKAREEISKANTALYKKKYDEGKNRLFMDIYRGNMSSAEVTNRALELATATGQDFDTVNSWATGVYDNKQKDITGAKTAIINEFNRLWGSPVFGKETMIETQAKNAALETLEKVVSQTQADNKDVTSVYTPEWLDNYIKQRKPNIDTVRQSFDNFRLQKEALNASRANLGDYDEKTKKWTIYDNPNPSDLFTYRAQAQESLNRRIITQKEYTDYMGFADDAFTKVIDNYQKKKNTVLGYSINWFKERYFNGGSIDYMKMSDLVDSALILLSQYGISYNNDVQDSIFYTYFGAGKSNQEQRELLNDSLEKVLELYVQPKADAVVSGNNVIVL